MKQKAPQKSQGLALKSNLNVSGLRLNPVLGVPGYFWAPRHPWRCFTADMRLLGGQTLTEMRAVKLLKSFPVCNSSLCSGRSGSHQTEVGEDTLTPHCLQPVHGFKDSLVCKDPSHGTCGWIWRGNGVYFLRERNEAASYRRVNFLTQMQAEVELFKASKLKKFNLEMTIGEFRGRRLKHRDNGGLARCPAFVLLGEGYQVLRFRDVELLNL